VFHACPETKPNIPTEFPWFFAVLHERVRGFLKCYKAGLATHAALEENICGPLSPEQFQ
jgi:hypothetical protein